MSIIFIITRSFLVLCSTSSAIAAIEMSSYKALGPVNVIILSAGTIFILIALGFLSFLWHGASVAANGQGDPGSFWQAIVARDWAASTITICAAVLRLAISSQLGVVVSMVGSLVLERYGVELGDAAFFTIVRAVSVQPAAVIFNKGKAVLRSSKVCGLVLLGSGIVAGVSTFTSTILLSDFTRIRILGPTNTATPVPDGFTISQTSGTSINLWRVPAVLNTRFAEDTTVDSTQLQGSRVDDTGSMVRALVPLRTSQERSTLRSYTGLAPLFDTRFTCFAPKVTLTRFNLLQDPIASRLFHFRGAISGEIVFQDEDELAAVFQAYNVSEIPRMFPRVPFSCAMASGSQEQGESRNMTVCLLLSSDSVLSAQAYLVLNVTGTTDMVMTGLGFTDINDIISRNETSVSSEGPWTTTKFPEQDTGIDTFPAGLSISITACLTAKRGGIRFITAASENDGPEPTVAVTPPATAGSFQRSSYDSEDVRRQLGATQKTYNPSTRGILTFSNGESWFPPTDNTDTIMSVDTSTSLSQLRQVAYDPENGDTWLSNATTNPAAVMAFPPGGNAVSVSKGNPSYVSVFSDTIEQTRSPARAMQALHTSMLIQRFYGQLERTSYKANATTVFSVEVFIPSRWVGFGVVVAVVALHLVVVLSTTLWFIRHSQYTLLGNSWQAVAQITCDAALPFLKKTTGVIDGEVDATLPFLPRRSGAGDGEIGATNQGQGQGPRRRYRIAQSDKGRVELALAS